MSKQIILTKKELDLIIAKSVPGNQKILDFVYFCLFISKDNDNKRVIKSCENIMDLLSKKCMDSDSSEFNIKLVHKNGLIYVKRSRAFTPYLRIDGYCRLCLKTNKVNYYLTMKTPPAEEDCFHLIAWKITGTHGHTVKTS